MSRPDDQSPAPQEFLSSEGIKRTKLRMIFWLLFACLLLAGVAWISPQQLPIVLIKLSLVSIGAVAGYWMDRELFPYARPDDFLALGKYPGVFAAACMLRRALIVVAAIVGITLGL